MLFFFFKQKTAYEMRISDWSSDVFSSDLSGRAGIRPWRYLCPEMRCVAHISDLHFGTEDPAMTAGLLGQIREEEPSLVIVSGDQIGRASCRERVCQYV